ncbi:hypothetical protein BDV38DRAFT_232099 [Aspergillus pseudotamarii]|uniref:Uncharacterized protein n=1 Tax=Aspergillus pseudotamarii TaxID=132259 RepID=A0A5N6TBS3_ASPPS|nr:uncharacterized protein BDV38DRAFT_232099 [Aspergillus pseudotamarii]KAE8143824.1 hypothetical protein BDV38DRAFT_232099 [Aspergillus pseudotamarii]
MRWDPCIQPLLVHGVFFNSVKLYLLAAFCTSLARRMTTSQIHIIDRNLKGKIIYH